jgi:CRISPR system Cascade subunit CasA
MTLVFFPNDQRQRLPNGTTTMNLTVDPWIPAIDADGACKLYSLQSLFASAHELRDLAVKPHERIALMRLLICITQAALEGPKGEDDWRICEVHIQKAVKDYLEKWSAEFGLFGEGSRFLQFSGLRSDNEDGEQTPATKIDLTLATGNTSTLFDNMAGDTRHIEVARAALNLLTFQCFSPGGRIGVAKWNGNDTPGKGSSNHAPCNPSSMLHTYVLGSHLRATIWMNLISVESAVDAYGQDGWGKPVWEVPVENIEGQDAVKNSTMTYLGRLVPTSRAIRLDQDGLGILLGNGLEYPIFSAYREAAATIYVRKEKSEEKLALLPASSSRGFWRQIPAITVKRIAGGNGASGPLALRHLGVEGDVTLWCGALITDKAKIEDAAEAAYVVPGKMFGEFGRLAYEEGVRYAESVDRQIGDAVKAYAATLKIDKPNYEGIKRIYWTQLEQNLASLFDVARQLTPKNELPESAWGKAVQRAAFAAYEQACPRQNPRQIQAYALGLRKLYAKPKSTKANKHE